MRDHPVTNVPEGYTPDGYLYRVYKHRTALGGYTEVPIYLEFNQTTSQFQETTRTSSDDSVLLVIDESQKRLIMSVPPNVSMIVRRAAERQARGITKSGFLCRDGGRHGRDHELEVVGEGGSLPDRLTRSPREVY
ncbi:MAG: hypothetical protein HXY34_07595 [Candidatus Thorarchaeota archaeon]|nr:hypothetical protein [Candidatus Thorarchaeota archaeon]